MGSEVVFTYPITGRLQSVTAYPWMIRRYATVLVNASSRIVARADGVGKQELS